MYKGETACVVVISRRVAGGVWALTRSGRRMANILDFSLESFAL